MIQLILGAFAGVVSAAIDRTRRKLRGERPLAKPDVAPASQKGLGRTTPRAMALLLGPGRFGLGQAEDLGTRPRKNQ